MRILVYGAGNIGSLYASMLKESGQDVTVLARGKRLAEIRDAGIRLENAVGGKRITTRVEVIEQLGANDQYDLVLVILPENRVPEVLPALAANRQTPSVMFFGNKAAGPGEMVRALGRDRVLLGFPGAAAIPHDHHIRYLVLSGREQPTTLGELDGSRSPRIMAISGVLKAAGFPVAVCSNMDAWLKTHAAEIIPTACALYMVEGDAGRLARTRPALLLMLRAVREGHRVLREHGIPIMPPIHRIFAWLPLPLLAFLARKKVESDLTAIKIGHASHARDEIRLLAREFRALAEETSVPRPAMDQLYGYLDAENR